MRGLLLALISAFGLLAVPGAALRLGFALFLLMVVGAVVDYWAGFSGGSAQLALAFTAVRVVAICVTQEQTGGQPNQWAVNALTTVAITMQWDWSPKVSLPAVAGLLMVDVAVVGVREGVPLGLRLLVECVMARLAFVLLRQSSRRVDTLWARQAALARAEAVAVARHRQKREFLALLHDTASATFLLVTAHGRDTDPGQVAEYARHDLTVLTGAADGQASQDSPVELTAALRSVVGRSPLSIRVRWQAEMVVPASAALALVRAVREALTNVDRHAGVPNATLSVDLEGNRMVVTVDDAGVGFRPEQVPHSRRGIRGSIIERMTAAGGSALVTSRPAAGTSVRLVWPDG
ncbi:ATP-binding protein [Micromonospora sp. NPDC049060]|uniref:sensor histidine kinase n=1 Tax=Micromonospora sp. NPDC049060 TaxID=3154828 RepID=UPI003407AA4E